jgi:hypothetical protein
MMDDYTRTISTFVDGEPIEPDHLAEALENPGARALLVDFIRMRAAVRSGDTPLPPSLSTFRKGRPSAAGMRVLRWPAVAALLVLVFLAGLVAPRPWTRDRDEVAEAPAPTRIEKFTPGVDWHQSN